MNLYEIVSEDYFYEVSPLSEEELHDFNLVIKSWPFSIEPHTNKAQQIFLDIKNNPLLAIDNIHSEVEKGGDSLIQCHSLPDISLIINNPNKLIQALTYIYFQLARTKKCRDEIIELFPVDVREQMLNLQPVIAIIAAWHNVEKAISNPDLRFTFVVNNTGIKFLTSDQPVIQYISDTDLFYPLSPTSALILHHDISQIEKCNEWNADKAFVTARNQVMHQKAYLWLFADTKEQLDSLIASPQP